MALSDFSSSPLLTNVALPLPTTGNSTTVTVVVRNALGSETIPPDGVILTIKAPSVQSLVAQFSSFSTVVVPTGPPEPDNSTQSGGSGSQNGTESSDKLPSAAILAVLRGAQAAINASMALMPSGNGNDGGGGASREAQGAALDGAMLAVMVLQVTACASVTCGLGVCTVGNDGPTCDCTGTGYMGPYCSVAVTAVGDSPTSTPSPSASPTTGGSGSTDGRVAPQAQAAIPVVPQKTCPSSNTGECSGHGECIRSQPDCAVTSVQCTAVCRYIRVLFPDNCTSETPTQLQVSDNTWQLLGTML